MSRRQDSTETCEGLPGLIADRGCCSSPPPRAGRSDRKLANEASAAIAAASCAPPPGRADAGRADAGRRRLLVLADASRRLLADPGRERWWLGEPPAVKLLAAPAAPGGNSARRRARGPTTRALGSGGLVLA